MEYNRKDLLRKVDRLMEVYTEGLLGGEVMPEDENPGLAKDSAENYAFFYVADGTQLSAKLIYAMEMRSSELYGCFRTRYF